MRIGPIEIGRPKEFAEKKPSVGKEFGATGTTNYGGILTEIDYNQDWAAGYGSKKWATIDEMRKSDGQVKKTLNYCKKPLIAAKWAVEPISDDKQDIEIAEFVEWNLFEGTVKSWHYTLNHFLLALEMGLMLFEKVWEYDRETGRVYCAKLAPRMPSTVFKWNEDDPGILGSVEQMVMAKKTEPMPGEKLVHFAIDQEFDNWEGESVLRSAYKHWKMKLAYEKISVMSYERFGMGIPVFGEPDQATEEDRKRADEIGGNLRAHESAHIRKPYGWDFEIIFGTDWKPADAQIRYHNEMISAAMLQQFTDLGTMDKGSRAVGEVLQDPFYLSLEAIAEQICEALNKQFIPELIGYNWDGVKKCPQLKCSNIRVEDYSVISDALSKLGPAGFVTPDFYIEQHLRQIMKLPELKEEEQRDKMPETDEAGKPRQASEGGGNPLELADFRRPPTDLERHTDFAGINSRIDTAADALTAALAKVRKEQAKQLARDLAAMAKTGRIDPNKVKVKYFGKAADVVKAAMREAYDFGKDKAAEELEKQKAADVLRRRQQGERVMADAKKPKPPKKIVRKSPSIDDVIENRADMIVAAESEAMKAAALRRAIPLIKEVGEAEVEKTIYETLTGMSLRGLRTLSSAAITEGINEGRADYAADMAVEYAYAVRSGLLDDDNICDHCKGEDGRKFDVAEAVDTTLPDPDCAGGDACRCVMVFVSREESKAVA